MSRKRSKPFIDRPAQDEFLASTFASSVIWNAHFMREPLELTVAEMGWLMEQHANRAHWRKLRDSEGVVRAIAMPRNHPDRRAREAREHRAAMRDRIMAARVAA